MAFSVRACNSSICQPFVASMTSRVRALSPATRGNTVTVSAPLASAVTFSRTELAQFFRRSWSPRR
ncbi:MAG: hypothetical protein U1F65_10755 [Verrucomicrobiota bacterium]